MTNYYLKQIADLCDIEKEFSSHITKHTFFTTGIFMNGIPIETVFKTLECIDIIINLYSSKTLEIKMSKDIDK